MLKYKYIYIRIHNMYISNESQTFLIQAPAEQSKSLHFSNFGTSQRIIHQIPKPPQKNREKSWKHLTKIVRHHFSMCFFLVVLPIIVMVDFPQIEWRYDCLRTFRDRCLGRRKRIRRSKKKSGGGRQSDHVFHKFHVFFVGFSKSTGLSWGFSYSQISQMLDLPGRWQKSCSANSRNLVFVDSLLKEIMVRIGSSESSSPWNKCQETSNFGYVWDDSPYHSYSS